MEWLNVLCSSLWPVFLEHQLSEMVCFSCLSDGRTNGQLLHCDWRASVVTFLWKTLRMWHNNGASLGKQFRVR